MLSKHIFQTLAFSRHSTIVTSSSLGNSRRFSTTESTFSSDQVPFARAKVGNFVQSEPWHENPFLSDKFLATYLARVLPGEVLTDIKSDLERFGERCATEIQVLGRECEVNPPYLIQTTAWGQRVDHIVTCPAWKQMKSISAEEGLIAIAYEKNHDVYSRLYQMVKLYMFSPVSGLYSCPLAMTDGAAKSIEALNLNIPEAFEHLTSRDPTKFWTSGQWMTERKGGSDVGASTETVAIKEKDDMYRLYGYKWFSSATDSDMTMTLARPNSSNNPKLSMFYLKTRDNQGNLNNIQVMKMKNKLGTRQLPTAELLLDGTEAMMVGKEGKGIASIANMLTITRLHNSLSAVGAMRKILSLARDYGRRRLAFGNLIYKHPLHTQTLARLEVEVRGCSSLFLDLALKLGREDCGKISDQDLLLLRLLTPVAKMYTAKSAMSVISEGLECFGGQGYIEDTGLPNLLRDSQVLPIWEGTSSVMSLDVVRAITKTKGEALVALVTKVDSVMSTARTVPSLEDVSEKTSRAVKDMVTSVRDNPDRIEAMARDLCVSIAHTYIATLLIEHALETGDDTDMMVCRSWCQSRQLCTVSSGSDNYSDTVARQEEALVYENYDIEKTFDSKFIR